MCILEPGPRSSPNHTVGKIVNRFDGVELGGTCVVYILFGGSLAKRQVKYTDNVRSEHHFVVYKGEITNSFWRCNKRTRIQKMFEQNEEMQCFYHSLNMV